MCNTCHNQAIQRASKKGWINLINILIEYGSDVNASKHRHFDIVKILLKHTSNIRTDIDFDSIFDDVVKVKNFEIILFLLQYGVNINDKRNEIQELI